MALQNILIIADHRKTTEQTIRAAVHLAKRHNAHLTGIYTVPPFNVPVFYAAPIPQNMIDAQAEENAEALARAKTLFEKITTDEGWDNRVTWHSLEGDPLETSIYYSHYADLTVMTQPASDAVEASYIRYPHVKEMALASGRPLLVIPETGAPDVFSERIVIGWDESREAARAIGDAMILLEQADFVSVSTVNASARPPLPGEEVAVNMAEHLGRHKISAQASYRAVDTMSTGEALLDQVKTAKADMLVIGAYGESRLRSIVLGSTTKYILENMTVPVLLSH